MLEAAGHLDVLEQRLEYRFVGPQPEVAPTLVFLHEGLGCTAMWRDFPDKVADATGCGAFVYSRQGYGSSSPCVLPRPLTYMHDEGERVLPALLDAIGFRRGLTVGHSDGGSIAAIHAGATQDPRLAGLVLMAPHFFTEDMGIASIAEAKVAYETTDLRQKLAKYHGENVDCAFWGWNRAWLDPDFRKWDLTAYLPKIVAPLLTVQGADDQYGTLAQVEATAASARPSETLVLPDCGHAPFKEKPEESLAAIAAFVTRCLSETAAARR